MILISGIVFVLVIGAIFELIAKICDAQGSDLWWWFNNAHIARNIATIVMFGGGLAIAAFGSWIEFGIATVWFGWVVVDQTIELVGALRSV